MAVSTFEVCVRYSALFPIFCSVACTTTPTTPGDDATTGDEATSMSAESPTGDTASSGHSGNTVDPPTLMSIELAGLSLDTTFDPSDLAYSASATFLRASTSVTVAASDPASQVRVNGIEVALGVPSPLLDLSVGDNAVQIEVDSADGFETSTYELTITRDDVSSFAQQAYAKASNTGASHLFGWTVALSGDTMALGAIGESASATGVDADLTDQSSASSGAVYVFTRTDGIWAQEATFKASNTDAGDEFGSSLGLHGDTLAVGAPLESSDAVGIDGDQANNDLAGSGAVYVFTRDTGVWSQQGYLKASETGVSDGFGDALDLHGDTLVVGAAGEDSDATGIDGDATNNNASNSGAVYVFGRNAGTWSQDAYVKASNTGISDGFGSAVAIHEDTIVVSAVGEDSNATGVNNDEANNDANSSGAAFVFVRAADAWTQQAYLKASNSGAADGFGDSVAISGDTIAIGATGEDSSATGVNGADDNLSIDSGAAYVFSRTADTWAQTAFIKASNNAGSELFAFDLDVDANVIAVGAFFEDSQATGINGDETDDSATDSGAAYVFVRNAGVWGQAAYIKASNTGTADSFGNAVAVDQGTVVVTALAESSDATGVGGDEANNNATNSGAGYVFE